jgi:hypothetical protein
LAILTDNLSQEQLNSVIMEQLVRRKSWQAGSCDLCLQAASSKLRRRQASQSDAGISLVDQPDFISSPISSSATTAGLRTMGRCGLSPSPCWSFPLGGARPSISKNTPPTTAQLDHRDQHPQPGGCASIIYGMRLAVFVRMLGDVTSGAAFG